MHELANTCVYTCSTKNDLCKGRKSYIGVVTKITCYVMRTRVRTPPMVERICVKCFCSEEIVNSVVELNINLT